jgi:hypothetical protein
LPGIRETSAPTNVRVFVEEVTSMKATIEAAQNEEIRLVTYMDPKTVERLEGKIEEAIAQIIVKMGLKKLPLLPARHTMHLMAKAAVAVYEAAVENRRPEE